MVKYRIKKEVGFDDLLGRKEDGLFIVYRIQEKVLWWWNDLDPIYGSKYNSFGTFENAEQALHRHVKIKNELITNGSVSRPYKL